MVIDIGYKNNYNFRENNRVLQDEGNGNRLLFLTFCIFVRLDMIAYRDDSDK